MRTHVITLNPADVTYKHVPLLDQGHTDLLQALPGCLAFIDQARAKGRVLVHCLLGISRSGSVCIAYLMQTNGKGFLPTWREAKQLRSVIHPNDGFKAQLEAFEKTIQLRPEGKEEASEIDM
jgi:protein-tyrosine phosphatase